MKYLYAISYKDNSGCWQWHNCWYKWGVDEYIKRLKERGCTDITVEKVER